MPKQKCKYDIGDIIMFTYDSVANRKPVKYYAIILSINNGDYHFKYLDGDGESDREGISYIDRSNFVSKIA